MTNTIYTDIREIDELFKDYYASDLPIAAFKERPLLAKLRSRVVTSFEGKRYVADVLTSSAHGIGATRAQAQAGAANNLDIQQWQVPPGDLCGSTYITDKEIEHSGSKGAFAAAQATKIDELFRTYLLRLSQQLWAPAGRALACTATISGSTVTVSDASVLATIETGVGLQASANDGSSTGHTLLGSGSIGWVRSVNRKAGTFTVSDVSPTGAAGTPSGWTGTMYLFPNGTFGGTSTPARVLGGGGIFSWLPATVSGGENFNGVDRSVDQTRLAGTVLAASDVTGKNNVDRIKALMTYVGSRGIKPLDATLWCNSERWDDIANIMEVRGYRELIGTDSETGLSVIKFTAGGMTAQLFGDPDCPKSDTVLLDVDPQSLVLFGAGGLPHVMNKDGLSLLRSSTDDAYEHRLVGYPGLCMRVPGRCGRVAME